MPKVVLAGMAARRFTGGETVFEVEADTIRRMIAELDRRFPGLGNQIDEGMAVAIDGRQSPGRAGCHLSPPRICRRKSDFPGSASQ